MAIISSSLTRPEDDSSLVRNKSNMSVNGNQLSSFVGMKHITQYDGLHGETDAEIPMLLVVTNDFRR